MATGTEPQLNTGPQPGGVRGSSAPPSPQPHLRNDRWWLAPAVTALGLVAFVVYSTWRAFANADYYSAPYVSPFYSPAWRTTAGP